MVVRSIAVWPSDVGLTCSAQSLFSKGEVSQVS